MILRLAAAFLISLATTAIVGIKLIPALQRMKVGQSIRPDGPVWHNKKQGTPTMGGVMFIVGIAVTCLTAGLPDVRAGEYRHMIVFVFAFVCAAIGFLDDYEKLKRKRNMGLTAARKFTLQILVSGSFVILVRSAGIATTDLYIPFLNVSCRIPEVVYFVFAVFVATGTINGVNITDGADGLASGVTIPVVVCYMTIAVLWGVSSLGVISAALLGGLLAFLFFNFHPAKVFMGDTGAQFLGGAICAIAFAMDMPLILLPLGIVYFIETLSDIIQVSYFKMTHGKRVFKMAPLHHHFEMCGWGECKLFIVFTAVSAVFAVISYLGVLNRY